MFVGKILLQHELQLSEVAPTCDAFGGFPDSVGRENTAENEKDCKHDSGAEQIPAARFVKDGQNKISEHPDQQPSDGDAVDDEILCFFFAAFFRVVVFFLFIFLIPEIPANVLNYNVIFKNRSNAV